MAIRFSSFFKNPLKHVRSDKKFKAKKPSKSVAFGTWQVGAARQLTENRKVDQTSSTKIKCSSPDLLQHSAIGELSASRRRNVESIGCNGLLSPNKRNSRLGESSPNLSRIHHTDTQLSLGMPNKMSSSITAQDFFSSTEYCQYACSRHDLDAFNGNQSQPTKSIESSALIRKSRRDEHNHQQVQQQHRYNNNNNNSNHTSLLDDPSSLGGSTSNNLSASKTRHLKYSLSTRRKLDPIHANASGDSVVHHRSHSAGPHTAHNTLTHQSAHQQQGRIQSTASTSEMNRSGIVALPSSSNNANNGNNTTFLRATKRFFKKIYSSATLPKKVNQPPYLPESNNEVDYAHKPDAYYGGNNRRMLSTSETRDYGFSHSDDTHRADLFDDEDDEDDTMRSENATMDISYPDSGFEMDRASTPEHSMTSTSKSSGDEQQITSMTSTGSNMASKAAGEGTNFENLFEQLKREMKEMRERDAQILADLQRVETQIQTVKQAQLLAALQDEFEPVESMQV